MRLRFLAAAGPAARLDRLTRELVAGGRKPPLVPVIEARGFRAWVIEGTPWIGTPDGSAAAIGLVFGAADGARRTRLPALLPPPARFVATAWGAYVLLGDRGGEGHLVLRDPSGSVTAYHRRREPLDLYASDAELLALAAPLPLEPDLEFLGEWLSHPYLRGRRTGIAGVEEILPGTAVLRSARGARETQAWSPWDHARADTVVRDFGDAAELVREAVLTAVPRLAAEADDPVVQLSGGLDSSIVAAALAAAGSAFRAVTFATRAPDGDERRYAREVAARCGIALAELVEETSPPDFEHVPALALRPPPNALLQPLHRALAAHFALTGADLVLDGAGGDNVFCYLNSAAPVLDAFRYEGLRGAAATAGDVARVHGTTFWAVARGAVRRASRRRPAWPRETLFLDPAAPAATATHPWLDAPGKLPRGSFEQVQSIVGIRHFLPDPVPGSAAVLHPLLAQPVLEACLCIPAPLWVRGGRDRAVAREALRDLLPAPILARRAKGRLESMFVTGYMAGRRQLEGLLLDGKLAQAGLLDRAQIRAYLAREGEPDDPGYIRLLELSSAETWLRSCGA